MWKKYEELYKEIDFQSLKLVLKFSWSVRTARAEPVQKLKLEGREGLLIFFIPHV
jgi:hypothetical protein